MVFRMQSVVGGGEEKRIGIRTISNNHIYKMADGIDDGSNDGEEKFLFAPRLYRCPSLPFIDHLRSPTTTTFETIISPQHWELSPQVMSCDLLY